MRGGGSIICTLVPWVGGGGIPPLLCIFSLGEYPQGRRMISLAHSCLWISGGIISYIREP